MTYQDKYLRMIEADFSSGGDDSGIRSIIDKIYADGFEDGENEGKSEDIEKLRKEALKDCWEYHQAILKDEGIKKSFLIDELYNLELSGWEDVGFFVGYLRALDDVNKINK